MKKLLAIMLLSLLFLSCFSACGGNSVKSSGSVESEPNTTPGGSVDVPTEKNSGASTPSGTHSYLPVVEKPEISENFGGREVNFFVSGGEGGYIARSIAIGEKDDPTNAINVAVAERNKKIEEELGVKIVIKKYNNHATVVSLIQVFLSSHVYEFDVFSLYQGLDLWDAISERAIGSLYNLKNMPEGYTNYLNLDAPYWSDPMMDSMQLNDLLLFATGDLSLCCTTSMFASYVNQRMWKAYEEEIAQLPSNPEHYTSVYDLVKNGYWTMDLWMDLSGMAWVDADDDKVVSLGDQVGFLSYNQTAQLNNVMTDMLEAGARVHYSEMDENGKPEMTFNGERNIRFAEKLYQLMCTSNAGTFGWDLNNDANDFEDNPYITEFFARGNALMTVSSLERMSDLSGMKDGFYVLPLPMLEREQFDPASPSLDYSTHISDHNAVYAICKAIGEENIPCVTATLELMAYYSLVDVTPVCYAALTGDGRYDSDSNYREMLSLLREGIYSDFAYVWSNYLSNPAWYFRSNYNKGDDIARRLREQNDLLENACRQLSNRIEEPYRGD